MSDKDRMLKDGQDKNKKNQARREAESNPTLKRKLSAHNVPEDAAKTRKGRGTTPAESSSSPPAARAYASKAAKGK